MRIGFLSDANGIRISLYSNHKKSLRRENNHRLFRELQRGGHRFVKLLVRS